MSRIIHALDDNGNQVGITISQDCVIFIGGVDPDQESIIQMTTTENVSLRTEFLGERPKREER